MREAALASLSRVEQSSHSLRQKLQRKGFPPEMVEPVLQRLVEQGLVDDQRYAQGIVDSGRRHGLGPRRLTQKLRENGIDSSAELLGDGWEEEARRLATQALGRGKRPEQVARWLLGRGFHSGVVRAALAEAGLEEE